MKPNREYNMLPFGPSLYHVAVPVGSTTSFAGEFRVVTTAAERFSVSVPNVRI